MSESARHWEERYGERERIWSGEPNRALVDTVGGLTPGRALDLGCGEGADSVWLARRGWHVTGVDIAANAVERARTLAAAHQIPDGSIHWRVEDLASWSPDGPYDLVSACFLHSHTVAGFPRTAILQKGAAAIAPGGHLLIVSHAEAPPWAAGHGEGHEPPRFLGPSEELAELRLDPGAWDTLIAETRARETTGPDGEPASLRDGVLLVHRRR